MDRIATVKCTHVMAQVSLGFYDEEGNLVGEETFPRLNGNVIVAKLFYPHMEQLASLIETCVEQAWAKLNATTPGDALSPRAGVLADGGSEPPAVVAAEASGQEGVMIAP
jgi:hypothetical protein